MLALTGPSAGWQAALYIIAIVFLLAGTALATHLRDLPMAFLSLAAALFVIVFAWSALALT